MNHAHTFLRLGAMSGLHVLLRLVTCALRSCIACVRDTSYLRLAISKLQLRSPSDLDSKFATFLPLSHLGIAPKMRLLIARRLSGLKKHPFMAIWTATRRSKQPTHRQEPESSAIVEQEVL